MKNTPPAGLRQIVRSRKGGMLASLILLNILIFTLTNPVKSAPIVIILGFLVLSFDIYMAVKASVWLLAQFFAKAKLHHRRLTTLFTAFLVVCLGLGSIGQLTWRDLLVVIIVGAVGYFYSLYFRIKAPQ